MRQLTDSEYTGDPVIKEISEFASFYIANHFPDGLDGTIREVISSVIVDSFQAGAAWAENQEPSRIITGDLNRHMRQHANKLVR